MPLRDDLLERAKARVGRVLDGKWHLDSVLGIGGMATVYAATHRNQKRVAIKMLHPEVSVDKQVTHALHARGLPRQHGRSPRRPSAFSMTTWPKTASAFLVMELLEGQTLDAHVGEERHAAGRRSAAPDRSAARRSHRGARQGHPASRSQAGEPFSHAGRPAQGSRFRNRPAARAHRRSDRGLHTIRIAARYTGFHGPRASAAVARKMSTSAPISGRWARRCTRCSAASSCTKPRRSTKQLIQTATKPAQSDHGRCAPDLHESVARIVDRALAYERKDRWPNAREFQQAVREAIPFAPAGPTLDAAAPAERCARRSHRRVVGRSSFGEHQPLRDADHRSSSFERGGIARCGASAARLAGRGSVARSARGCGDLGAAPAWPDGRDPTARRSVGTRSADSYSSGDRPGRSTTCARSPKRRPSHRLPSLPPAPTSTPSRQAGQATQTRRKPPVTTPHPPVESPHPPTTPDPPATAHTSDPFDQTTLNLLLFNAQRLR